jgi:hypothetical protein
MFATVVIVEHEALIRQSLARRLRADGYEALEAETGRDALEHARRGPALVLLESELPDIDGASVLSGINITSALIGFSTRPTDKTWINLRHKLYDYDNNTPEFPVHEYVRFDQVSVAYALSVPSLYGQHGSPAASLLLLAATSTRRNCALCHSVADSLLRGSLLKELEVLHQRLDSRLHRLF